VNSPYFFVRWGDFNYQVCRSWGVPLSPRHRLAKCVPTRRASSRESTKLAFDAAVWSTCEAELAHLDFPTLFPPGVVEREQIGFLDFNSRSCRQDSNVPPAGLAVHCGSRRRHPQGREGMFAGRFVNYRSIQPQRQHRPWGSCHPASEVVVRGSLGELPRMGAIVEKTRDRPLLPSTERTSIRGSGDGHVGYRGAFARLLRARSALGAPILARFRPTTSSIPQAGLAHASMRNEASGRPPPANHAADSFCRRNCSVAEQTGHRVKLAFGQQICRSCVERFRGPTGFAASGVPKGATRSASSGDEKHTGGGDSPPALNFQSELLRAAGLAPGT